MLAAVLGHEIGHVMERHSVENLGVSLHRGQTFHIKTQKLTIQFLNVAAVAFDVLRGISFALTISFPLYVPLTFIPRPPPALARPLY